MPTSPTRVRAEDSSALFTNPARRYCWVRVVQLEVDADVELEVDTDVELEVDTDVEVDAGVDFHESGPAVLLGESH